MSFQMSVRNQLCSWVARYIQMLKILLLIVIEDTRKDLVGYQYMVLPKMKCALALGHDSMTYRCQRYNVGNRQPTDS